jgi:hypothetical protein
MGIIRGRSKGIVPIRKGDRGVGKGETRLTNSPTPIEGINKFIYKKDRNDPSGPASDICSSAKGPIPSGPRDTRSDRVGISGDSDQRT